MYSLPIRCIPVLHSSDPDINLMISLPTLSNEIVYMAADKDLALKKVKEYQNHFDGINEKRDVALLYLLRALFEGAINIDDYIDLNIKICYACAYRTTATTYTLFNEKNEIHPKLKELYSADKEQLTEKLVNSIKNTTADFSVLALTVFAKFPGARLLNEAEQTFLPKNKFYLQSLPPEATTNIIPFAGYSETEEKKYIFPSIKLIKWYITQHYQFLPTFKPYFHQPTKDHLLQNMQAAIPGRAVSLFHPGISFFENVHYNEWDCPAIVTIHDLIHILIMATYPQAMYRAIPMLVDKMRLLENSYKEWSNESMSWKLVDFPSIENISDLPNWNKEHPTALIRNIFSTCDNFKIKTTFNFKEASILSPQLFSLVAAIDLLHSEKSINDFPELVHLYEQFVEKDFIIPTVNTSDPLSGLISRMEQQITAININDDNLKLVGKFYKSLLHFIKQTSLESNAENLFNSLIKRLKNQHQSYHDLHKILKKVASINENRILCRLQSANNLTFLSHSNSMQVISLPIAENSPHLALINQQT